MKKNIVGLLVLISALFASQAQAVEIQSSEDLEKQINDAAAQVSSTLDTAKKLIKVATTTTGIAVDAYNKTEHAVSSTVEVVRRGSAVYENLKPIIQKIGDIWNYVTNNNEYWRVAVVVFGILVLWVIIRFAV